MERRCRHIGVATFVPDGADLEVQLTVKDNGDYALCEVEAYINDDGLTDSRYHTLAAGNVIDRRAEDRVEEETADPPT